MYGTRSRLTRKPGPSSTTSATLPIDRAKAAAVATVDRAGQRAANDFDQWAAAHRVEKVQPAEAAAVAKLRPQVGDRDR